MAALGVCAAYFMIKKNRKYANVSSDQVADILFLLILSGVIGARLFYIISYFDQFKYNYIKGYRVLNTIPQMLLEMLRIDHGGLVFYGGFICAVIAMIIYCRRKKLDFWMITDMCVPGLALGHAFGRVGCFLNGCCFGKTTEMPCAITYPAGTLPALRYPDVAHQKIIQIGEGVQSVCSSMPLHPVQLYESLCNVLLAVLLNFSLKKLKRGQNLALYMFLYGVIRFSDEFFRGDYRTVDFFFGIFTPGQFIGLFIIPIGIGLFVYFQKQEESNAKMQ